jgi:hypothetical protein
MSTTLETSPSSGEKPQTNADRSTVPGNKPGKAVGQHRPAPERSREAKQRAAAILEVLAGVRTPTEASRALGVSVSRYYLLEEKALAGLLAACEPVPRGPGQNDGRRCAVLEQECQRWQRECARQQALVRAAQRTIGLAAPPPPSAKDKGKKRRRRPVVRALQAAAGLRPPEKPAGEAASTEPAMKR